MGMSWGDYGALEGAGVQRAVLGRATVTAGAPTGKGAAMPPVPSSALTETGSSAAGSPVGERQGWQPVSVSALSGAAVSPHQQEPTLPGSPAVPPLTEAGGTTAHDPAAAPLSALTEEEGATGEAAAAADPAGVAQDRRTLTATRNGSPAPSSSSVSASDHAYTLPPKAGMVPPVPRAGRAQL